MAIKLPRVTIDELDRLIAQLTNKDSNKRESAMIRLTDFERSGKIPLEVLLDMCEAEQPSVSMYAITALGRNGEPAAVKKLLLLLDKNRNSNPIILDTIIDALGQAKNPSASAALLNLLGVKTGWVGKLFKSRKGESEKEDEGDKRLKEYLTLPVIRALEQIEDPKVAELMGDFLSNPDHLVRWHAVQNVLKCTNRDFDDKLKEMAKEDENPLVREIADIALEKLGVLPPNLNN